MSSVEEIDALFQNAAESREISKETLAILQKIGMAELLAKLPEAPLPSQPKLHFVGLNIDDSESIETGGNKQHIINGHNAVLTSLGECMQEYTDSILFYSRYMKEDIPLNNWVPLWETKSMTDENYYPAYQTPLYDSTMITLASLIIQKQRARQLNRNTEGGILIVTDGKQEGKTICTIEDVRTVITDLLMRETNYISLMGIGDTDFRTVAEEMGIRDSKKVKRILTPESEEVSMRRAFNTFSNQAKREFNTDARR